ncbi:YhgE/Pip domain-containing protein [Leucobacter sp. CSA1]|uniref:YhgE/Pip domain-containing protein n=1 Tax=Leucobacter chromiisoli TaxID=2796471 RepID=A0A934Q4M1_9MICO|nr:YhgE/Pip domain-containing protein [Leucobacter chromiisoli]MBK0417461.1 YhgE/Pip domain-containing protein [Leucobacter chromiisoli]
MSATTSRLRGRRPVTWRTVIGLVLVPLTVAGVLLWGLWNPQERLEGVTAAVVNLDEPAEIDGQTVPLGRVLAGELIGGDADQNFTWVLTDEDDASEGLEDGRYATVVTIPENFSSAATSLQEGPDAAETATIDIDTSDRGRLLDSALSNIVTQTATGVLNQQLGAQFVGNVFVGMTELHGGVGDAADGAAELADGGSQLADGAGELADGAGQLAEGTAQLSAGAAELSSGTGQLASGVGEYVGGAAQLAQSYRPLAEGTTAAVSQLQAIVGALAQLEGATAGPQAQLAEGLTAAGAGAQGLGEDAGALYAECLASGATQEFCDGMLGTLSNRAAQIGGGVQTASDGATGLGNAMSGLEGSLGGGSGSGGDPATQLDQLIAGTEQFRAGLETFAAQGSQLASGASQLSTGASQLAAGTGELAAQTPQLADGAAQLADGTRQSADGADQLAQGLRTAADEIPNYSEAERERVSDTAVRPVEATGASDELFNASGVPLFAGIALWAGALAAFLVLAPLWRRTRDAARGVLAITLRSSLPALGLGAAQGAIAGVVLPVALGYDAAQGLGFFGLALMAGIAFALVAQGLSALLGGLGRFVAFALLIVSFAVGIVATVPGPLQAISDASPIGAAFAGFQAVATGAGGGGGSALLLALWGLGGVVLTGLAVMRARRVR